jgi:hypothetical protein
MRRICGLDFTFALAALGRSRQVSTLLRRCAREREHASASLVRYCSHHDVLLFTDFDPIHRAVSKPGAQLLKSLRLPVSPPGHSAGEFYALCRTPSTERRSLYARIGLVV